MATKGIGWYAACSPRLGYCEVQSDFIVLRRDSRPDALWIVSLKAGTATAMPWVKAMKVERECACDSIVLTPGENIKVLSRPDAFVVTDPEKATTVIAMFLDPRGREITLHALSREWSHEAIRVEGFMDALDWVDGQQGRSDRNRTAGAPSPAMAEIAPATVEDTERFTDPERTIKELPEPVRKLFAAESRRAGCKAHPDAPNRPYFHAHWPERDKAVFFVECERRNVNSVFFVYAATAPTYGDARPVPLAQWDGTPGRGGKPGARHDVYPIPSFMPANTLVLDDNREGARYCGLEHTYRWLDGTYRLLAVRAAECKEVSSKRVPTTRFMAPVEER